MAALTKERDSWHQGIDYVQPVPMKGNTKIYNGALVMTDATGFAVPAADAVGGRVIGRANSTLDTTAAGPAGLLADGALSIECAIGLINFNNPAGANQLTAVDRGGLAYVLTDNELIRAAGTTNSRIAGRVYSVDTVNNQVVIDLRQHSV